MMYDNVDLLPFDDHGWLSDFNRQKLSEFILLNNVTTVIEIGSWLGLSTMYMAKLLPEKGKVFAIDTWEGNPENKTILEPQRLPTLYQQFLSNVIHENLQEKIVPVKVSSSDASTVLDVNADLIYIDASHDGLSVYNDIVAWYPHLNNNGVICGDDFHWRQYPGVVVAVNMFAQENNLIVNTYDRFWWYTKNTD